MLILALLILTVFLYPFHAGAHFAFRLPTVDTAEIGRYIEFSY